MVESLLGSGRQLDHVLGHVLQALAEGAAEAGCVASVLSRLDQDMA